MGSKAEQELASRASLCSVVVLSGHVRDILYRRHSDILIFVLIEVATCDKKVIIGVMKWFPFGFEFILSISGLALDTSSVTSFNVELR